MYVVRRPFRGPHGPMVVGSIVEPTDLRDFNYRLREKHIVEITEQNYEKYKYFFKQRFGIDLAKLPNKNIKINKVEKLTIDKQPNTTSEAKAASKKVEVKPTVAVSAK